MVQPDLTILCDPGKWDDRGAFGRPDLAVEILSPSTAKKDRWIKFKLYERAGIPFYWIVEPGNRTVEAFSLNKQGNYELTGVYSKEDQVDIHLGRGFTLDLGAVFS